MCQNLLKNSSVACHFLKGDLEPFGVMFGIQLDVFLQVGDGHVFPRGDFFGIDAGDVVALANPYMVEFVLGETLPEGALYIKVYTSCISQRIPISSQRRREVASSSVSPFRGWLQQVLVHRPGEWYLDKARCCMSSSPFVLKMKTEKAR